MPRESFGSGGVFQCSCFCPFACAAAIAVPPPSLVQSQGGGGSLIRWAASLNRVVQEPLGTLGGDLGDVAWVVDTFVGKRTLVFLFFLIYFQFESEATQDFFDWMS